MPGEHETEADPPFAIGSLAVDPRGRTASIDARPLDLTPKEFDLLHLLARQPGRAYSREYLLQSIWGHEYIGFDEPSIRTSSAFERS